MMLISHKVLHTDFDHSYQNIKCNVNFDSNVNTISASKKQTKILNSKQKKIALDAFVSVYEEIRILLQAIVKIGNGTVITYDRLHECLKWDKNKIAVLLKILEDSKIITRKMVYKGQTTGGGMCITINTEDSTHDSIEEDDPFEDTILNLYERIEKAQQVFSDLSKRVIRYYLNIAYMEDADTIYITAQKAAKELSMSETSINRCNMDLRSRQVINLISHSRSKRGTEIKINFNWKEPQKQILLTNLDVAKLCNMSTVALGIQIRKGDFPPPDYVLSGQSIWRKETVDNFLNKK